MSAVSTIAAIATISACATPPSRDRSINAIQSIGAISSIAAIPPLAAMAAGPSRASLGEDPHATGRESLQFAQKQHCQHSHSTCHAGCCIFPIAAMLARLAIHGLFRIHCEPGAKRRRHHFSGAAVATISTSMPGLSIHGGTGTGDAIGGMARPQNANLQPRPRFGARRVALRLRGNSRHLPALDYQHVAMHLQHSPWFHLKMVDLNVDVELFPEMQPRPIAVMGAQIQYLPFFEPPPFQSYHLDVKRQMAIHSGLIPMTVVSATENVGFPPIMLPQTKTAAGSMKALPMEQLLHSQTGRIGPGSE